MSAQEERREDQAAASPQSEKRLPLRDLDEAIAEAEMGQLAEKINRVVSQIEEGQVITQEILQLEFNV